MAMIPSGRLARSLRGQVARQWSALTGGLQGGSRLDPELRDEAAALHRDLSSLLQLSDPQAARARATLKGLDLPPGTDWRWRPPMFCGAAQTAGMAGPDSGQRLGGEVSLWHDCPQRALILRQCRNRRATDLAPYGMRLEVLGFTGSYLSLSLDLPADARQGLGLAHVLRLDCVLQAERPITVYARLNLSQGPNTAQMLRQLGDPIGDWPASRLTEFDLAYAGLTERDIGKVWLDLIFEAPHMNAVTLSDAVLSRHPRAEV